MKRFHATHWFLLVLCFLSVISLTSGASPVLAKAGKITEYLIPTPNCLASGITLGPDGNLWFGESYSGKIGRITPQGTITEFLIATAERGRGSPDELTTGPDGNLWFTDNYGNGYIGKMSTHGQLTEYPIPGNQTVPWGITTGPDGNLWFTETFGNTIGKITPSGHITQYSDSTVRFPLYITAGPDGNLWFTNNNANEIGKITPSGTITEYPIPTRNGYPMGITRGPDGNLWFTEYDGQKIGKITPVGHITEYPLPSSTNMPQGITTGPDGNLWFAAGLSGVNHIGRITLKGQITVYPIPTQNSATSDIAAGPDGYLWFVETTGNKIGKITSR